MNKKEYLTSFLKPGQKRLPRKLKKLYLKKFYEGGPTLIWTKEQFLNLYTRPNEEVIYQSINRLLNTPSREIQFKPSFTHDYLPKVKTTLTDVCTSELDNGIRIIF